MVAQTDVIGKKMMLTVSVLMVSITFSASRATPKKQCVSAQPNLHLVGTAGACPSNGVQTPWCTESKNVMIQTIRIHLSHSSASSEILCPKEAPFCPKNNEVLFSESCAIFIGFGLFGFVLRLFRVSHYCAKLPLLDWT
jgi:hypothetical protein